MKVSFSSLFIVAVKTTHSFTISHDQFPLFKELFPPPKSQTSTILPDILHFGFASLFLCSLLIQFSFGLQLRIVLSWQVFQLLVLFAPGYLRFEDTDAIELLLPRHYFSKMLWDQDQVDALCHTHRTEYPLDQKTVSTRLPHDESFAKRSH